MTVEFPKFLHLVDKVFGICIHFDLVFEPMVHPIVAAE
ncbi:hypothetical protein STRDD11_02537 [Streptococcus sp. DD11]|nr:hypothetical protein STRDD11_02537 [Streptococcus sp. DD11]